MEQISKTKFKAHALEVLRDIETTGKPVIITDRGKPTLEIRKLRRRELPPLEVLKGNVIKFEEPATPVADDGWEHA